jgi:hypothetical protein
MAAAHTSHARDGDPLPAQDRLLLFGNPTDIAGKGNFVIKNSVPLLRTAFLLQIIVSVAVNIIKKRLGSVRPIPII